MPLHLESMTSRDERLDAMCAASITHFQGDVIAAAEWHGAATSILVTKKDPALHTWAKEHAEIATRLARIAGWVSSDVTK